MPLMGERYKNDGIVILSLNELQKKEIEKVKSKIFNGAYPLEYIDCDCGNRDYKILAEKDRYSLPVTTVICTHCGLLLSNPRLSSLALNEFYNLEYRKIYIGSVDIPNDYKERESRRGRNIFNFIYGNKFKDISNVLEIGAGAGGLLVPFREIGCNVLGIDVGEHYIEQGGTLHGIPLVVGTADSLIPKYRGFFDLVILSHAFEHFCNIKKELDTIRELLSMGGILYVEVPGIKNLLYSHKLDFLRFLQNAHNYHFTLGTLRQMMGRYGFELVIGDEKIRSIFKYNPDLRLPEKNYYPEIIRFLLRLERWRRLYRLRNKIIKFCSRAKRRLLGHLTF